MKYVECIHLYLKYLNDEEQESSQYTALKSFLKNLNFLSYVHTKKMLNEEMFILS